MKEFNSQVSRTWFHCWGTRLALTRPPGGLGQRVLGLKPGPLPPRQHFYLWRAGIAVKIPSACSGQDNLRLSPTAETWQAHQSLFRATSPLNPSTGRPEGQDGQARCFGFGCCRQQKRHAAAPPPAAVRRRMERKRQKPVGRDKGSLTEQQTEGNSNNNDTDKEKTQQRTA